MNNMGKQTDKVYGTFKELKDNDANISKNVEKEKLTREEKRKRFIANHSPRESYRNYNGKHYSFLSVVFEETLTFIFAVFFFGIYVIAATAAVISIIFSTGAFVGSLSAIFFIGIILYSPVKRVLKRALFRGKLKKLCRINGLKLYCYRNFFKSLLRPSGKPDFAVESTDTLWEVMFFPAPKRLSVISFSSADHATIATRILKNRFTESIGVKEKLHVCDYRFEETGNIKSKKVVKALLLNPVPYNLNYYDKKDNKVVPGGTGAEFFGYTAYSGSGFLNTIGRV